MPVTTTVTSKPRAAYGRTWAGPLAASASLDWLPADDGSGGEPVHLRDGDGPPPPVDPLEGTIPLRTGGVLSVTDDSTTARFHRGRPTDPDEVPHPSVTSVAMVLARRTGTQLLHAGGLVGSTGVWGLVAERGGGKSTLLAAALAAGASVHTDDILLIDEQGRAPAGPRCIDLRPEAAASLELDTTPVRGDERHRVTLPPSTAALPVAGLVVLRDSSTVGIEPVPISERLPSLLPNVDRSHIAGTPLLDLASLPMRVLTRPRDWDRLDDTVDALRHLIHS